MRKVSVLLSVFLLLALSGCSVVAGIFKAGAVVAILAVVVVIAIIIWIASLFRSK